MTMYGQAQIVTKKMKLEDFPEKITKIVLPGNIFLDGAIMEDIQTRWRISPFEFCSLKEFETLKTNPDYYFLLTVTGKFRKETEPGLMMLSLVKGGENASKGIDKMLEVVTIPVCPTEYPSGRELNFLPAFIDIIQEHVLASMAKNLDAYAGLSNYTLNIASSKDKKIVFGENDIFNGNTPEIREMIPSDRVSIMPEEDADELLLNNAPNTLVSYVVAPHEAAQGSYCYKMLIDCETHKLYYFRRHRISKKYGAGFLAEDLMKIIY